MCFVEPKDRENKKKNTSQGEKDREEEREGEIIVSPTISFHLTGNRGVCVCQVLAVVVEFYPPGKVGKCEFGRRAASRLWCHSAAYT